MHYVSLCRLLPQPFPSTCSQKSDSKKCQFPIFAHVVKLPNIHMVKIQQAFHMFSSIMLREDYTNHNCQKRKCFKLWDLIYGRQAGCMEVDRFCDLISTCKKDRTLEAFRRFFFFFFLMLSYYIPLYILLMHCLGLFLHTEKTNDLTSHHIFQERAE